MEFLLLQKVMTDTHKKKIHIFHYKIDIFKIFSKSEITFILDVVIMNIVYKENRYYSILFWANKTGLIIMYTGSLKLYLYLSNLIINYCL